MIAAQRRAHRLVWLFVAPLLGAATFLLILARPPAPRGSAPDVESSAPGASE